MKTIDLNVLETVTGGVASVAATTGLPNGGYHLLKRLGTDITNVAAAQQQQSNSNNQTLMLAALVASRRGAFA